MFMNKLLSLIPATVLMLVFVLLPDFVLAQGQEGFVPCRGRECNLCHLIELGGNVLNWLVGILSIIAVLLFVYAGIRLVTSGGNTEAKELAKNIFTNVLIGYIIVLAAWLLVDTGMKILLRDQGSVPGLGPWNQVQCVPQPELQTGTWNVPLEGFADSWEAFLEGGEGWDEDFELETEGCDGIVEFAQQMQSKGCIYSQARRNGCQGNPGYTDCSDLVHVAYRASGCSSPGVTTAAQHPNATSIGNPSTLRRGDAVVYRRANNTGHVVICMNDGCSTVIHASGTGRDIVTGNGAFHYNQPGARVVRCQNYC